MKPEIEQYPAGWRLSTVGQEYTIENTLREPLSEEDRKEMQGIYPYYGPTKAIDFLDHYRIEGTYALIGEDGDHFLKYRNQDMTQLVKGQFNVNNHAHLVRGNNDASTEWFFQFFRNRALTPYLTRQGAGRYKLNKETLQRLPIVIPSRTEQFEIHAIIQAWDRAISLTERLIAAKLTLRKGLMQQLLTGKQRFPGFSEPWRHVRLGEVFERVTCTATEEDGELEPLSITAGTGFVLQRDKFSRVIAGNNLERYVLLRRGDFSYNKGNSKRFPQGCIYRLKDLSAGLVPNVFYSFRALSNDIYPEFYEHFFESGGLNHELSRVINTGVRNDGLLNLDADAFFAVAIPLPPVEEQKRIAKVLHASQCEISHLRAQLAALKTQKRGLMQQLLTGKVRVSAPASNPAASAATASSKPSHPNIDEPCA